jgi:hypothetical protein
MTAETPDYVASFYRSILREELLHRWHSMCAVSAWGPVVRRNLRLQLSI